jgi:hypothetical protein
MSHGNEDRSETNYKLWCGPGLQRKIICVDGVHKRKEDGFYFVQKYTAKVCYAHFMARRRKVVEHLISF